MLPVYSTVRLGYSTSGGESQLMTRLRVTGPTKSGVNIEYKKTKEYWVGPPAGSRWHLPIQFLSRGQVAPINPTFTVTLNPRAKHMEAAVIQTWLQYIVPYVIRSKARTSHSGLSTIPGRHSIGVARRPTSPPTHTRLL